MNKILLLSPRIKQKPEFPIGLAYVAGSLVQQGYNVIARDLNFVQNPEFSKLLKEEYVFIGITGYTFNFSSIEELIKDVREVNKSPIVLGGMIVNSYPEFIARNMDADFCVYGEGEITSVELANYLSRKGKKLEQIGGIIYKDNGKINVNEPAALISNLDEIPFPAWQLFKSQRYFHSFPYRREAFLISSRGCPGQCTFCFRNFGGKYRYRSPENVINEIKALKKEYKIEYAHFRDECFYFKEKDLEEFCTAMIKEKIRIGWATSMRLDGIKKVETYQLMRSSGCDHIHFGVESGSEKMMKVINKTIAKPKMLNSIRLAKQADIHVSTSYLLGMPGETKDTLDETHEFTEKTKGCQIGVYFPIAFPGSWIYDYARENNFIKDEVEYLRSLIFRGNILKTNYTDLTDEYLLECREKLMGLGNERSKIGNIIYEARRLAKNKQYYTLARLGLYLLKRLFRKITNFKST